MTIPDLLKAICLNRSISLLGLSKRTGLPYRTLQDWMYLKSHPTAASEAFLNHLLICKMSLKRKATPKV